MLNAAAARLGLLCVSVVTLSVSHSIMLRDIAAAFVGVILPLAVTGTGEGAVPGQHYRSAGDRTYQQGDRCGDRRHDLWRCPVTA